MIAMEHSLPRTVRRPARTVDPQDGAAEEIGDAEGIATFRSSRFSRLPLEDEAPLLLISCFGKFSLRIAEGTRKSLVRSRIAFAVRPCPPAGEGGALLEPRDFWACRTTFALDVRTGRPHRLIWGLDAKGRLVTFLRPGLGLPEGGGPAEPILIPTDKATFDRCMGAMSAGDEAVPRRMHDHQIGT